MKREYIYIVFIIILVIALFSGNFEIKLKNNNNRIKTDSVLVVKNTEEKKGSFQEVKPQPTIILLPTPQNTQNDVYLSTLLKDLDNMKSANEKRDKLLNELALRVYEKTYQDSTVTITVKDSVNGHLQSQNVQWTVKPQKVEYYKKTITEKVNPKFSLLVGAKISTSNAFKKSDFEVNAGFQNKKGNIFEVGYNTDQLFTIGYKLNVFRKY